MTSLVQQKLVGTMQGDIYEALMIIGVKENAISFFIRTKDSFVATERDNFLQTMKKPCRELLDFHKQCSSEYWKNLPKEVPEKKKLLQLMNEVRKLWRKKPQW